MGGDGRGDMGGDAAMDQGRGAEWPPPPELVPVTRDELATAHGSRAPRRWHRVRRSMYVSDESLVTPQVIALAEVRAHDGAALSGATAARALGHPWVAAEVPEIVQVNHLPRPDPPTVDIGCRDLVGPIHRCRLRTSAGDAVVAVAGPVDVTIDCVAKLPDDEAIAFLDGAIRIWNIHDELLRWADAGRGRGTRRMRELLTWADWRAESRPESLLRTKLRLAGQPEWVPQLMVGINGVTRWLDLGDADYRIAIDYHGADHWKTPEARKRDAARVNDLRQQGWWPLEVTALDLFRDFDALLRRIDEYRRSVDAERARGLEWRRGRAIDAARAHVATWLT